LRAEQQIRSELASAEVVRRLKQATVYLKNQVGGKTIASGTGFVIEVHGNAVIVATNRHIAVPDAAQIPFSLLPQGSKPAIEAVFGSGQSWQEQSLPAQVIAADTSGGFSTDLALLVVKGVIHPPAPIDVQAISESTEGMVYLGAGFPLGRTLDDAHDNSGNPWVRVTRGFIAALQRDEYGDVELLQVGRHDLFQVDGSVSPGGPIVEERTGRLIGIGVAEIRGAEAIGLVVPAEAIRKTLAGRVGALDLTLKALDDNHADLEVQAEIVDPRHAVQRVLVHAASASAGTISPNSDGTWPELPNTRGIELQRQPGVASASGPVRIAFSGQGAQRRKILIQTAHQYGNGKTVYSRPRQVELPKQPGPILRTAQVQRLFRTVRRSSLARLGPLIDPEQDCKLVKDEDTIKINIEVPGNKLHTLDPEFGTRLDKKKPLHNAPMSLIEVEGDFAALVQITAEIRAGSTPPQDRQGNSISHTLHGAGLLLYHDRDNFVRLERTAGVAVAMLDPVHKILFDVVKDGKHFDSSNLPVPEGPIYLLLMRRKGRVIVGASSDLDPPPRPFKEIDLDLPSRVKVGLSASNISAKPFTATFENFAVFNDVEIIDAVFGDSPE
jgi:hypothetical protein